MVNAIVARAQAGVTVRVVLEDPSDYASEVSEIKAAGGTVVGYSDPNGFYIHAKAMVADYGLSTQEVEAGSMNISSNSLDNNRELGIILTGTGVAAAVPRPSRPPSTATTRAAPPPDRPAGRRGEGVLRPRHAGSATSGRRRSCRATAPADRLSDRGAVDALRERAAASSRTKRMPTTVSSVQLCFRLPIMRPNIRMQAVGTSSISTISKALVHAEGFSKGWALLALKTPPPSPVNSLIGSQEATGPSSSVCLPPATVLTLCPPPRLWITPPAIRISPATTASGSRIRKTVRSRSAQKLPRSSRCAGPGRGSGPGRDRSTAAEAKAWTPRPAITAGCPVADSPA